MGSDSEAKVPHAVEVISEFRKFAHNKWLRMTTLLAVLGFAIYYIFSQSFDLLRLLDRHPATPSLMIVSTLLILISVLLGIVLWWLILAGFGYRLSILETSKIHIVTTLAKYIPGLVWQFSGKTYLSNEAGVPVKIAGFGLGIEVVISLISGIGIAFILSPIYLLRIIFFPSWCITIFQIIGWALLIIVTQFPILLKKYLRRQISGNSQRVDHKFWFFSVIVIMTGWGLLGTAFFVASNALGFSGLGLDDSLFAVCASYVGGILVIFVPNGLVVREALMLALLPTGFDPNAALLLSLLARLQVVTNELLIGAVVGIALLIKKKHPED